MAISPYVFEVGLGNRVNQEWRICGNREMILFSTRICVAGRNYRCELVCSVEDEADSNSNVAKQSTDREQAAARRTAMKDLLYRKDS